MPVTDDQRRVRTTPATNSRPPRLARLLAVLAALAAMLAAPATASAATPPAGFAGLGNWSSPTAAQAQGFGQVGLRTWRAGLVWNWIERTQGNRNWSYVDQVVRDGAKNGYDILLVLNGCAEWACGATRVAPSQEPQLSAYRAFIAAAVARYRRGGEFWAANPTVPFRQVSWQVWNEVNAGQDWPYPNAAAYAAFLAAISQTIKSMDPTAVVVTSGLTEYPAIASGATLTNFLSALYAVPGFRESFDVLAVHGYAESPLGVVRILDTARRITAQNGDGNRRIWVTELGWSSGGPAHPFTVDEATQYGFLQQTYDTLLGCRGRWNLDRAYWFSLNDIASASLGEADYWGHHTGLLRVDNTGKPAWGAFIEYLGERPLPGGRGDGCPLAGGGTLDVSAIDTAISDAPKIVGRSASPTVSFGASREARFECSLDSAPWTPCQSPVSVKTTREGGHELAVRAIDSSGLADTTPARVTWMLDLTPPDTELTRKVPRKAPTSNKVLLRFKGSDATGIDSYQCRQRSTKTKKVRRTVRSTKRTKKGKKKTTKRTVTVTRTYQAYTKWKPCKSGERQKVSGTGTKRLQVRAVDKAGNADPKPAQASVKVNLSCLKSSGRKVKKTKRAKRATASAKRKTSTCRSTRSKKQGKAKAKRTSSGKARK